MPIFICSDDYVRSDYEAENATEAAKKFANEFGNLMHVGNELCVHVVQQGAGLFSGNSQDIWLKRS